MYELSIENTKLIAGGNWVYVTPEWKHSEAVMTGQLCGAILSICGAALLCAEISCVTLSLPIALGAAGYGIGYAVARLDTCSLENNTWHYFLPLPVIIFI